MFNSDYWEMVDQVELAEMYDEHLDDAHPKVQLLGLAYRPSRALYCLDENAYYEGLYTYIDSLVADGYLVHGDDDNYYREI